MTPLNKNRRNFLKVLAFGGGALVLGKIFGPKLLDIYYGPTKEKDFENFKVTEDRRGFIVSSKDGEEVFVMDNDK